MDKVQNPSNSEREWVWSIMCYNSNECRSDRIVRPITNFEPHTPRYESEELPLCQPPRASTREHQMWDCGYLLSRLLLGDAKTVKNRTDQRQVWISTEAIELYLLRGTWFPFCGRGIVSSYNTFLNAMKQSTGTFR
jgi:hypothetical protein